MIRKKVKAIDTYYSKSYEDPGQEFLLPSLTDQSYFMLNDIYCLLEQGQIAARPLQFGEQLYDSFEDIAKLKREFKLKFDSLSHVDKARFGNSLSEYIKYVSDPSNYIEVLPSPPVADQTKQPDIPETK